MSFSQDFDMRDLLLVLLSAAPEGKVPGRTLLQKAVYFSLARLSSEVPFDAHYFGPYSVEVADSISSLVSLGFVEESQTLVYPGTLRYEYKLSEEGKEILELIEVPQDVRATVEDTVRKIVCNDLWGSSLAVSTAAKTHFILHKAGEKMDMESIAEYARGLGWKITPKQIESIVKLLLDLNVVRKIRE